MHGFDLFEETSWQPFAKLGFTHPLFSITAVTVVHTWIILVLLFFCLLYIRHCLRSQTGIVYFLATSYANYFIQLCQQSLGGFSFAHFSFVTSLFTFIFLCNAISIIPWLEEPTKDLNTTLALGLIAFFYTQTWAIKIHGIVAYIKEFFTPFFLMLPLNIVGRLATIVSISFRLFGNIFGGAIITQIYLGSIKGSILLETLGLVSGINLLVTLFFGLFEGFLQAFVFAMLTLTYLSIAIFGESGEQTKEIA